jgi:Putative prokaryotic signal transducing protein
VPLIDPIDAYNAANNMEAHLVCNALIEAGVNAVVVEDTSVVGMWFGGVIPEIHKPQVWVERADTDRAKAVLEQYERQQAERRAASSEGPPVKVLCEECGVESSFPAEQRGTVQDCPYCHAYVDVDEIPWADMDESGEV